MNAQRLKSVVAAIKETGAKRVLDLGCGEGRLLQALMQDKSFEEIVGLDVSARAVQAAAERLDIERLPANQKQRLKLFQGSLTYRDKRLRGYDAAAVVEVVEHFDPLRLAAFEQVVFRSARPSVVVLTTPNAEYNVKFESLPTGKLRHRDHRFEWTRPEFQAWAKSVAERFSYSVQFRPVGLVDPEIGPPTQMGVFLR